MNYYDVVRAPEARNPMYGKTHVFKVPFRMAIVGSSGSGKTNTLLSILDAMPDTFVRVILCVKSADEPLYNLLRQKMTPEQLMILENGEIPNIKDISLPDTQTKKSCATRFQPQLVIFDDLCLKKDQNAISEYFIRARKSNISCCYISQSFFKIPREARQQLGYIIIKKNAIMSDFARILKETGVPLKLEQLVRLYHEATQRFEDFFLIDTSEGQVYKTFSLTPMATSPIIEDAIIQRPPEDLQWLREDSVNKFVEILKEQNLNGEFDVRDLYMSYKDFVEKNHLQLTAKTRFGVILGKHFDSRRVNNKKTYFITS